MRVLTNVNTLVAQKYLQQHSNDLSKENSKLSSGERIVSAADDPAGFAISETLKSKVKSNYQAERNTNDSISMLQVAEGTLGVMAGVSGRLRELAIQAANDTIGESERLVIDKEFQSLKSEIERLTVSTSFNGNKIVNAKGSIYDFQVGITSQGDDRVRYDMSKVLDPRNNFGIGQINLRTKNGAQNSLSKIDNMLSQLSASRAEIGSMSVRMNSVIQNLQVSRESIAATNSKIRDADVAVETAIRMKEGLLQSASLDMLKNSNENPGKILKLIA
jgi:flagellin